MILILVVALFAFGECTGEGAVIGISGDYRDLFDNLKKVSNYGAEQYDTKGYIDGYKVDDNKKGFKGRDDNINDGRGYLVDRGYDDRQKNEGKEDIGNKNLNGDKDRSDDKSDGQNRDDFGKYYTDDIYEKYDGPKDYVVSDKDKDKDDRPNSGRKYGKMGSDLTEYDYVPKCDVNIKECKDGRDCYDKAKDRLAYDTCRDTYGNEGRYYDEQDRYIGDRYRFDTDRYGYENDCYDNSNGRAEYDKCRQYYRRCSEYNRQDYNYTYNEQDWKNDRDCYGEGNLVGLGRNDREDQLIRPCALEDWQCIRKYFAKNSNCKPAYGPIPDPLYLKRNTAYLPFANITLINTRLRVTGLSSIKIIEFYVNKDTKNLVIAFDFRKLNETTPRAYLRYKRTAKESIVLSDYGSVEFSSGTFTAVIPRIPHLRLDLAEVHADIDDLAPPFFIGPNAANSTDPDVITGFARLLSNLPVAIQEFFLLQSQLLTAIYIQENICDFGLKLISI